jgi:hypothetical protein
MNDRYSLARLADNRLSASWTSMGIRGVKARNDICPLGWAFHCRRRLPELMGLFSVNQAIASAQVGSIQPQLSQGLGLFVAVEHRHSGTRFRTPLGGTSLAFWEKGTVKNATQAK